MLIAQISDTHLVGFDKLTCDVAAMDKNLARCIDHLNQMQPRPDVVVHTGDVTDRAKPDEYRQAKTMLEQLKMPYFVVPGNHDDREGIAGVFAPKACSVIKGGFVCSIFDKLEVVLIGLDSTHKGRPGGRFCPQRLKWLEQQLSSYKDRPVIIFMHHPPQKFGVPETDEDGYQGADDLKNLVACFPNIERVICGHIHLTTHAHWAGTIVSTSPSMGMQLGLDLTMQHPSQFLLEDPAFQLHHWTPQKNLVTHTVFVRHRNGPYSFGGNLNV